MKYLMLYLFFGSSALAEDCIINTYPHFLTGFNGSSSQNAIKNTTCNNNIINSFQSFIVGNEGTYDSLKIAASIGQTQLAQAVTITPDTISIMKINNYLKNALNSPEELSFVNISNQMSTQVIPLNEIFNDESHEHQQGLHKIQISKEKSTWIKFKTLMRKQVLVAIKNISRGEELVENVNVSLVTKAIPIEEQQSLRFEPYTIATKNINKDDIVTRELTRKSQIITAMNPVHISIESGGLNLSMTGIAMQSGTLGEAIQIKFDKTNKIINAKIIGPNKAKVEL